MSTTAETVGRVAAKSRRRPSRAWYWLAAGIAALGVVCGVTWGVLSTVRAHDHAEGLPRTSAPGTLKVSVDAGTSRLVFFEGEGKPSPEALGLTVTAPDGSSVPVQPYDLLMQYEIAGWVGAPVASFSAPTDGTYVVSAQAAYKEGARISVGDNFVRSQAIDIVGALALIGLSLAVGVVIAVVTAVKR